MSEEAKAQELKKESKQELNSREDARSAIAKAGITSENVTTEHLENLMLCIDIQMTASGNYHNSFRMDKEVGLFTTCSTDQWEGREAVSFNRDGFICFAGWADNSNVKPILDGVFVWLKSVNDTRTPAQTGAVESWMGLNESGYKAMCHSMDDLKQQRDDALAEVERLKAALLDRDGEIATTHERADDYRDEAEKYERKLGVARDALGAEIVRRGGFDCDDLRKALTETGGE